jgi:hypothetical protein
MQAIPMPKVPSCLAASVLPGQVKASEELDVALYRRNKLSGKIMDYEDD